MAVRIGSGGVAVRGWQWGAAVGRGSASAVLHAESVFNTQKMRDGPSAVMAATEPFASAREGHTLAHVRSDGGSPQRHAAWLLCGAAQALATCRDQAAETKRSWQLGGGGVSPAVPTCMKQTNS